jgi:hypothetical protein
MFSPLRYVPSRELAQVTPLANHCLGVAGPLLVPWGGILLVQVFRGEAEGWFGAIVAGFFALTLVAAGIGVGLSALAVALARQGTDGQPFGRQVRRWLRSCVSARSFGLAVPNAGMAAAFLWGLTSSGARFGVPDALSEIMGIEFLCIHSTVFLGFLALSSQTRWWTRCLKYWGLVMLFAMYLGAALNNLSERSVLSFAYLTLAKLATFRWHRNDETELISMALRWAAQFMFFMFTGALTESIGGGSQSLSWGACYFGTLSVLELFGAFILPEAPKGTMRDFIGVGKN